MPGFFLNGGKDKREAEKEAKGNTFGVDPLSHL
jgi:hypothetical protein